MEIKVGDPYYANKILGKRRRKVLIHDKIVHIPLEKTLTSLLKRRDIREAMLVSDVTCTAPDSALLSDMSDGSVYKCHPVFSQNHNALQIVAYYDEIELCNPLGSHTKLHKLGCLFFTLGNIPPKFRSQLKCIFLVSIAASPIIRKHGIDEILNPFVRDLRDLAANKLHVFIDGKVREFEVALLAFLADNLGAHQIGGFKESMSFARRICRSCMTTTADAQHNFVESQFKLRIMEQHSKECDEAENDPEKSKEYGINRRSILESIPNFSCAEGLPHDIMHDLFEGVVPYELKLLLAYYITTKKYFTLHQLNMRIQNYGYGYTEVSDKPSQISDINHIRQSAAQMWLLASLLPLLIGLVPEECEYWKCFITLLRICSIAAAWSVSSSTIDYLTVIIEEHHQLFKKLYPDMKIIPKMHYMVHYSSQIRKFGPLVRTWTMRYESKLRVLKRASRHGNFKNICKTVAKKHQHLLCYYLNMQKQFLSCDVEIGPISLSETLSSNSEFCSFIDSVNMEKEIIDHPKFIKYERLCIRKDTCVLISLSPLYPVFCKVIDLISFRNSYYVKVQESEAICFDSHYNSFRVLFRPSFRFLLVSSLPSYPVLHIHHLFTVSNDHYITVKHFIEI